MGVISMKALLEAGVHFGHQTRRWNPKMAKYIYTSRNGIHIIDLQKSSDCIDIAYKAMFEIAQQGGRVLFVGTKKQSQDPVKEEAIRSGQFYVDKRWLGGTLTNFKTIKKSIKKLHDLYKMEEDGTFALLPKKEVIGLRKEMERLEKFLGGIKEMRGLPQALFIIDPRKERNAILEARKLHIPVFGIIDTNCDPDEVDFIIPANDDALRSVKLIVGKMADAVIEANGGLAGGVSATATDDEEDDVETEETEDEETAKKPAPKPVQKPASQPQARPYTKPAPQQQKPYVKPTETAKPAVVATPVVAKPVAVATPVVEAKAPVVAEVKAPVEKEVKKEVVAETKAPAKKEVKKEVVAEVKAPVEKEVKKPVAAKAKAEKEEKAAPVVEEKVDLVEELKAAVVSEAVSDLESKTVSDLKEMAKEKGLTNYSKLRKAELIAELLKN